MKAEIMGNKTFNNSISSSLNNKNHQQQADYQKAILYTSVAFFLIFINSMTIVSYFLRKKSKRCIPDLFMLSLAISSILTMLAVILILAFIRATGNESYDGLQALCYIQVFFGTMLRMLDVSITTAIMIDRFLALYKPLLYRVKFQFVHGKIVCAILWIESALIAMLPLVGFGRVSMHMESFCTADWTSEIAYIVLIIAYISFGIVLFTYVGIFRAISSLVSRQETMKNSQSLSYMSPRTQHKAVSNGENNGVLGKQSPPLFSSQHQGNCNKTITSNLTVSSSQSKSLTRTVIFENNSAVVNSDVVTTTTTTASSLTGIQQNTFASNNNASKRNRVSWIDDEPSKDIYKINRLKIQPPSSLYPLVEAPKYLKKSRFQLSHHHHQIISKRKRSLSKRTASNIKKLHFSTSQHLSKRQQRKNKTTIKSSSSSLKDFRTESLRFAKVMGVVVFLFYISWIPLAVSFNKENLHFL